jgi:MFS transporter, PAT family, beta-lactamase induction signal transducer AmpG
MSQDQAKYKHPLLWVPTSYFAMGTVYTMVTTAANIMFANLGLPNEQAAAYSSLTGFAFTFKPFWAPLLELYRTKKFFVVLMQIVLAGSMAGLALSLKLPAWVTPVIGFLMIAAIAGATQDIGTDGVYVTTLDSKRQAAFTGVQSLCWSIGPIIASGALVLIVGKLAGEVAGSQHKPAASSYASAWVVVFAAIAGIMGVLALWHSMMLPPGAKATDAPKSFGDAMSTFGKAFASFFQKKDVMLLLGFAFFYRFGLGLLDKIAPLFVLDSRATGGLGLDNSMLGWLNGIIGTAAFMLGSILGGMFVARRGLKKSLLILCLALNVPNVTFLFLGIVRPVATWHGGMIWPIGDGSPSTGMMLVAAIFFVEKLGWGFGAVGHMIYMMQQIAPGPYKTAHYAFATGIGLSLCMTLTGLVSGFIQQRVGYLTYFIIVLFAAGPSILFTLLAPFHQGDGFSDAAK